MIQHTRELTVFGGFWYYQDWEDDYRDAGFNLISSVGRPAVEMIKKEVARYDKYEAVMSLRRPEDALSFELAASHAP